MIMFEYRKYVPSRFIASVEKNRSRARSRLCTRTPESRGDCSVFELVDVCDGLRDGPIEFGDSRDGLIHGGVDESKPVVDVAAGVDVLDAVWVNRTLITKTSVIIHVQKVQSSINSPRREWTPRLNHELDTLQMTSLSCEYERHTVPRCVMFMQTLQTI